MKASGQPVELPEVDQTFLIDWLCEIGPSLPGAMGPIPITFGEIDAWVRLTGTELAYGEALLLRQLSQLYCVERQQGATHSTSPALRLSRDKSQLAQGIFAALRTRSA